MQLFVIIKTNHICILKQHIDLNALEAEWRSAYDIAYADFQRYKLLSIPDSISYYPWIQIWIDLYTDTNMDQYIYIDKNMDQYINRYKYGSMYTSIQICINIYIDTNVNQFIHRYKYGSIYKSIQIRINVYIDTNMDQYIYISIQIWINL